LGFQNARAQEPRNKLKFVGRQTGQKAARLRFHPLIRTRNKGGYQGISHGWVSGR
jgi:hypothetical protein